MNSRFETILFISGRPVSFKKAAEVLKIKECEAKKAAEELQKEYNESKRGFRIVIGEKEAEMVSAPENKEIAEKMRKGEMQEELSQAAMEVLAIILHKGPVLKAEIEEIRGVNCSIILRNLLIRGLIEKEKGSGGEAVFRISLEMMKKLGTRDLLL